MCEANVKSLTEKQSKIYEFIGAWQMENGYPPTQAEIRNYFGFGSLNAVRSHLVLIEKKGYIRLNSGKARGIQLELSPAPVFRQQKDYARAADDGACCERIAACLTEEVKRFTGGRLQDDVLVIVAEVS